MPEVSKDRSPPDHFTSALIEALQENRQAQTEASRAMAASIERLAAAHDTSTREIRDELRALGKLNTAIVVVAMLGLFGLLGVRFSMDKGHISTGPMNASPMGSMPPAPSDTEIKHDPDEKPVNRPPTSPLMSSMR